MMHAQTKTVPCLTISAQHSYDAMSNDLKSGMLGTGLQAKSFGVGLEAKFTDSLGFELKT